MKLDEAINSDLPFRRKSWSTAVWLIADRVDGAYGGGELKCLQTGKRHELFYVNDLMANDYELKTSQV